MVAIISQTGASEIYLDGELIHSLGEVRSNRLSQGFVILRGQWKIKVGDNPGWALPDFNDSLWQTAFNPTEYLLALSEKGKTPSIVWFRKKIKTDSTINGNIIAQVFQSGASEIYLNGELIHKLGKVHNDPDSVVAFVVPTYSAIKNLTFPLQKQQEYTLAVRFVDRKESLPVYSKMNTAFFNIRNSTLEVASNVKDLRESQKFYNGYYLVLGTISFMFILFLALFLYFPAQKINLYFSLSSLLFALYIIQSIRSEYVSLYKIQDILLTNLSVTGYLVLLYLSFYKAFGQKLGRLFWVILSVGIFISPLNLLFDIKFDQISLFAILLIFDFVRICIQAIKQKNRAALVLLILSLMNALYLAALILDGLSIIIVPQIFR